jgi:hypothetical protein
MSGMDLSPYYHTLTVWKTHAVSYPVSIDSSSPGAETDKYPNLVRVQVLTAPSMRMTVFWDIALLVS